MAWPLCTSESQPSLKHLSFLTLISRLLLTWDDLCHLEWFSLSGLNYSPGLNLSLSLVPLPSLLTSGLSDAFPAPERVRPTVCSDSLRNEGPPDDPAPF